MIYNYLSKTRKEILKKLCEKMNYKNVYNSNNSIERSYFIF